MNISKKALMSFIVTLTSVVSMAQPYYHIMKDENGILTEETGYDSKDYKIKIDMVPSWKLPKGAIGGKITISSSYGATPLKRSFYFTKNGNVYYNNSEGKFHFEKSQLDYPKGPYSKDHCGHFRWGRTIEECIDAKGGYHSLSWSDATETDFYFANPENLPKLQEDLGNEEWAVLSLTEWSAICDHLGKGGWQIDGIDGERYFLIDTTPGQSLFKTLDTITKDWRTIMSKEDFEYLEAQGLVCFPRSGVRSGTSYEFSHNSYYWSCTPNYFNYPDGKYQAWGMKFDYGILEESYKGERNDGLPVRLVILAD